MLAKDQLQELIDDFELKKLQQFLRLKTQHEGNFRPTDESLNIGDENGISDLRQLGQIEFSDTQKLLIVIGKSERGLSERSGKKAQYEKAKKVLKELNVYEAGIFVFYDGNGNFRFSLTYPEYQGKRRQWSNFRRFTYFVSKEFTNKTFLQRVGEGDFSSIEKIKDAFSVEKVTKEFYLAYRKLFEDLVKNLKQNHTFKNDASRNRLDTENFAKKLLGQVVFLYFLQKKGWMGVPQDKPWGVGDKNFLSNLFREAEKAKKNFYNDYLEPLFYDTLNNPRRDSTDPSYSSYFKSRIPFLNGGLFEPEYNWKDSLMYLDNKIFGRILEAFDRYNFTVEEESPDDKEVAVDPEMLGKVFENLLPENLRKGKGAYYTPREIVYYMCRESLVNYLTSHHSNLSEENIRKYFEYSDALNKDISELKKIWKGESFTPGQWKELSDLLKSIKVCDPACGSGAFLVGMLNEVVKLRMFLQLTPDSELFSKDPDAIKDLSEYQLKKETIQNCLYGVDIDPGAIEIAKLRLWLSLIVDYNLEHVEPLPNLDYRLMTGNSLIEEFEGEKFYNGDNDAITQTSLLFQDDEREQKIEELKVKTKEYFNLHDDEAKKKKRGEINALKDWFIRSSLERRKKQISAELKEQKSRANMLDEKSRNKYLASWEDKFFSEGKIKEVLDNLHNPKKARPFFLWKLEFIDVFEDEEKRGFDVVIANPPYVRADSPAIKEQRQLIMQSKNYQTLYEKWDLYVAFIERGFQILKIGGVLEYIIPNAYMSSKYAIKSHDYFLGNATINRINFLNEIKVFEAAVKNIIIEFKKIPNPRHVPLKIKHSPTFLNFINLPSGSQEKMANLTFKIESDSKILGQLNNTTQWGEICYVSYGLRPSSDERYWPGEFKKDDLISSHKDKVHSKPYIEGKWIKSYVVEQIKYLEWDTDRSPRKLVRPTFPELYRPPKIMMGGMTGTIFDDLGLLCNHSITVSVLWKDLKGIDNKSISGSIKKDFKIKTIHTFRTELEKQAESFELKYLLSILNSKLGKYYLSKVRRSQIGFYPDDLKKLPIKNISKKEQEPFIVLVNKILAITKDDDYLENSAKQAKVHEYEKQIDQLVYKLYGLTPEEIKIVENEK